MVIGGQTWVDARGERGEVLAFINGQQCGRGQSFTPAADPPGLVPFFAMAVASDAKQHGCGVPGAVVTFTLNGRTMNNTVLWKPGANPVLRLFAGPAFALYSVGIRVGAGRYARRQVYAFITDVPCGDQLGTLDLNDTQYLLLVYPEEIRPGCGRDGAAIDLILTVEGQPDIDLGTALWQTDTIVERPTIDLTDQIPSRH